MIGSARGPVCLGLGVLSCGLALVGCGSSNADRSYDCRLATPAQVAAATDLAVTSAEVVTSDSGPADIRACLYHFGASTGFAEVWSLRSGSDMYHRQAPAAVRNGSSSSPLRLPGVTGVAGREAGSGHDGAFSYALVRGTYLNWVVVGSRNDGVQAVRTLTSTAAAGVH